MKGPPYTEQAIIIIIFWSKYKSMNQLIEQQKGDISPLRVSCCSFKPPNEYLRLLFRMTIKTKQIAFQNKQNGLLLAEDQEQGGRSQSHQRNLSKRGKASRENKHLTRSQK